MAKVYVQKVSEKAAANGYADLDGSGHVPAARISGFATSSDLTTHAADTTAVHGIANTSSLVQVVVWDGTGSQPARPAGALMVIWLQDDDPGVEADDNDMWIPGTP